MIFKKNNFAMSSHYLFKAVFNSLSLKQNIASFEAYSIVNFFYLNASFPVSQITSETFVEIEKPSN